MALWGCSHSPLRSVSCWNAPPRLQHCSAGSTINSEQPHTAQNKVSISQHPSPGSKDGPITEVGPIGWECCVLFLIVLCKKKRKERVSPLLLFPNPPPSSVWTMGVVVTLTTYI